MPASNRPSSAVTAYVGEDQLKSNLTPYYSGGLHAAIGDGVPDDNAVMQYLSGPGTLNTLTPTALTVSVARCWTYTSDEPITVNRVRWFGIGANTVHRLSVYRLLDKVQVIAPLTLTMTADAWNSAAVSSVRLAANTPYIVGFSATATGATAGIRTSGLPLLFPPLPTAAPGNLAVQYGGNRFWYGQFAVTNGVMPATLPTLVRGTGWTAGLPLFFFDSNSAA